MAVAPLRSPTATGSGTGSGRRAPLSRRPGGGGSSGSRRPRKIPQFPQKKPDSPPPPTPFQPGSPPAPLLNPLQLAGLGLVVLGKILWDALNYRPTGDTVRSPPETSITFPGGHDRAFVIGWFTRLVVSEVRVCGTNQVVAPAQNIGPTHNFRFANGNGISTGTVSGTERTDCGSGTANPGVVSPSIMVNKANGTKEVLHTITTGKQNYSIHQTSTDTRSVEDIHYTLNGGQTYLYHEGIGGGDFAPGMEPQPPALAPPQQAAPFLMPLTAPALLPAAVPGSSPAPAPAPAPGGLPAGQPATPPAPSVPPAAQQIFQRSSPGSGSQTITASGVSQAPAAPIVPVTPAEAVLIGGQLVGGPGSSPPQGPGGTAAELGRLEGKSELALSKLGQLAPLLESIEVLQALGEWLLSANGGVTYTLQPPCGTDANGDPLPPVEVVVPPTIGVEVATLARLDALAMLIDEHKQMRQPICKGKPTGSPVTVTGVELDP